MTEYISQKTVEAVMDEVANTPQDDVGYTTDKMLAEQPIILEYLYHLNQLPFSLEENITFNEAERNYILYIGIVLWKTLYENAQPMRSVTRDDLRDVITDYELYFFDMASQGRSEIPGAALLLIENHPEPELLRFITDAIRPDPKDPTYPPIRPQYRAMASTLFHIVLRALLASRVN